MNDSLRSAGQIVFWAVWVLSFGLLYYIIKTAVRNGVQEANERMLESVREIENDVHEIKGENKQKGERISPPLTLNIPSYP